MIMSKIFIDDNKWFDDDGLIRCKNGGVNWGANLGRPIEFQYYDYYGYYTIKRTIPAKDKWYRYEYVICFDDDNSGNEYIVNKEILRNIYFSKILNLSYAPRLQHKTQRNFLYNIGDVVNGRFLILERECKKLFPSDKYEIKTYKCKCLCDDYIFEDSEYNLNHRKQCAVCKGKIVIRGVNDIATKRPEIVRFLKNKDDAYKYAAWSKSALEFTCDICGKDFNTSPHKFNYNFPCGCHSLDSYPNRLIQEIFVQLEIPHIRELRKKHFSWCKNYRYDLYFESDDSAYIVEMDGRMHEGKQLEVDRIKDNLATANGIEVIRIDCAYPKVENRLSYIKNNLLKSSLSTIIDLSKVNWDIIDAKLLDENTTKKICDLRNQGLSYKDIMNTLDVSKSTIDSHIRIGKRNGLLNEWALSNFHKKEVFEITNLNNEEKQYCIGVHKFFKDAEIYIGRKLSSNFFKKYAINGYLILDKYGIRKISYYEYLVKTAQI
jgi:very-short-patch-repair endonuclease